MTTIGNISCGYLQSILGTVLQNIGVTTSKTGSGASSIGSTSSAQQPDTGQLSPFAQLTSTLQQLQQSNPTQYQQVTQQIATNLQSAAQTAQASGNSTAASQLNQLATDFTNASQSGQLPNPQDLAKAVFGHHHSHQPQAASAATDAGTSASSTSGGVSGSTSANQTLSQLLSAIQSNEPQSGSLNPMAIILNTLSSAGVSGAN